MTELPTPVAHGDLMTWLTGKSVDKMIAAMSTSARAKKSGRVIERIRKTGGKFIFAPRVVKWDKTLKFVYAMSFSTGRVSDAVRSTAGLETATAEGEALFQTDIYLRTQGEYTELDAVVVAGLGADARAAIAGMDLDEKDVLTAARIFSTGLDAAAIAPDVPHVLQIPVGDHVAEAVNLPIERIEHEETHLGQVLLVTGIHSAQDAAPVPGLKEAMTKEGHPGEKKFGVLVASAAQRIET